MADFIDAAVVAALNAYLGTANPVPEGEWITVDGLPVLNQRRPTDLIISALKQSAANGAAVQTTATTIQGRISRVVEVALVFAVLGTRTITITFDPPMPNTNYVLFQSKTGGTLGLAQLNFTPSNKTVNGCILTAQGLAIGTIGVAILTVPPYGATAVVS